MESKPKKLGRPTIYTEELAQRICKVVATHSCGLKKLCEMFDWMPDHTTIHEWRWSNESFSNQYTKAKLAQAELMAEDCINIADDSGFDAHMNEQGNIVCDSEAINRARLRVDTRKWLAAKLLPKMYGDQVGAVLNDNESLRKEVQELRAQLDEKNKKEF